MTTPSPAVAPVFDLAAEPRSGLRAAITAATRRPEAACLPPLLDRATLPPPAAQRVAQTARTLITRLRGKGRAGGVEGLIHEYSLSSQEGVALMCLAEALLRIPDTATRDALIRDKIAAGDWRAHVGHSPSMFVNAATWGLLVTGKLTATTSENTLSASLTRLIARGGEPIIRRGVDLAMRLMGEQFVTGQTIAQALANASRMEARGFRYSYDMLGEAAATAEDAAAYRDAYRTAIHAIGHAAAGRGIIEGPGISIKLSALHPRYSRSQRHRVMTELLPDLTALAALARSYDIGLNIDAEEADRLDLSLDLLEALAHNPDLAGWNGIGFVIQAYGKRCPFVVDWIIDLARRTNRRIMVRLVKGAYWDTEIKRAQVDGLKDYPVFTRKPHTDVSYLACARKLLDAPNAVFPQFATHNAQTLATILEMAGPAFRPDQYEFQCLHGMGEPLYEEVVGPAKLNRPCRIYAPVGTHETLLAYLVRRLLENGANTSFVNRIADASVPVDDLAADPVAIVRQTNPSLAPHPRIAAPRSILGPDRLAAAGLDLADENTLAQLAETLADRAAPTWTADPPPRPIYNPADPPSPLIRNPAGPPARPIRNPANQSDIVGQVHDIDLTAIPPAIAQAAAAAPAWAATPPAHRAAILRRAADAMETAMPRLIGLVIREAGKSFANAVAEVREAVDFLRYYATESIRLPETTRPLGSVACISPWNFPLAIFTGQVAAALAAGNTVLAKPAEETPLIAAEAVRLLHAAGIPPQVLHLLLGDGAVGAALVADPRIQGVIFTGSTQVARLIQRQLADRLTPSGQPVPLIAETGGQNAMVVDSSALAEQVVADVIASAFDSAGQRCSALRILCVQDDVADRIIRMLQGAMWELSIGDPSRLSTDVGPVISAAARDTICQHIETMRRRGHAIHALNPPDANGFFVPPTIIEISRVADVEQEVFGPVLHVLRYQRDDLDQLIDQINATGYGLTFGLHTRIDETIARVLNRIQAGNIYINRNIIGAVVGVQPFGGMGLSGTGPKAGGPRYLARLTEASPQGAQTQLPPDESALLPARHYQKWLASSGHATAAEHCARAIARSALGTTLELPGPVGERNIYRLQPKGRIAAIATTPAALLIQIGAVLATGNTAVFSADSEAAATLANLPRDIATRISIEPHPERAANLRAILFEGDETALIALNRQLAEQPGPIIPLLPLGPGGYDLDRLLQERAISTNTAAAGGNASLMTSG